MSNSLDEFNETSNEDYEKLRYISYSMRDSKWYSVKHENINNDTYEFLNSGASGMVYVNKNANKVVKIIRLSDDKDELEKEIIKSTQEVKFQSSAAKFKLAPRVYFHGYINTEKSFLGNTTPYYYIVMDYLSPNEWDNVYGDKDNKREISLFVKKLIEKVGIVNTIDPRLHFYKNKKTGQIVMIDYDHCEKCDDDEDECIRKMMSVIITNGGNHKTHRRASRRRASRRRVTHKRKTYKNRKTHNNK